ncbi:MAG: MFS transporter, partial [Rubrobacteraceae bacterium]
MNDGLNYRPILLAVAVATAGVLPAFLTGGLAVQIRSEMHFGVGDLGLLVAAFFVSSALSSALFGRLVERIGSHRGMRAAALASAASLLCVALLARSWGGLLVCLIFGGFANAVSQPATHLSLAREVPPERQGLSFGIKQAAIPTATLLAGLAVPVVAITVGWRWAFAGAAALALIVALLVPAETLGGVSRVKKGRAGDAHTRPLVLLAFGIGLGSMAATPLGAFISGAAVSEGLRAGTAGLLLALGSATGITVRVLFGILADRMNSGRLRLVSGMLVVGAVGFALLASGIHGLLVVGTLLAFGAGWGWPGLFNFAIVRTNPGAPAAATGITQTGASGGAAIGPLVFGFLVEATSHNTAWMAPVATAVAAAGAILVGRSLLVQD